MINPIFLVSAISVVLLGGSCISETQSSPNRYDLELSSQLDETEETQDDPLVCKSMEDALKNKDKVHTLWLRNNKDLIELDPRIGELKNLKVLNVSGTNLTELPEEIGNCSKLEEILANASKFKKLPESIGKLKNLNNINFSYNDIDALPTSIVKCTSLERVSFGSNNISVIPEGFGKLKNIGFCDFANNNLTKFSLEFVSLTKTYNLWLHGNEITFIPTEITQMKSLTHLLIDETEVTNLDEIKTLLPELRIIDENNR